MSKRWELRVWNDRYRWTGFWRWVIYLDGQELYHGESGTSHQAVEAAYEKMQEYYDELPLPEDEARQRN